MYPYCRYFEVVLVEYQIERDWTVKFGSGIYLARHTLEYELDDCFWYETLAISPTSKAYNNRRA